MRWALSVLKEIGEEAERDLGTVAPLNSEGNLLPCLPLTRVYTLSRGLLGTRGKLLFFLALRPVSQPPANQTELLFYQHVVNGLSIHSLRMYIIYYRNQLIRTT